MSVVSAALAEYWDVDGVPLHSLGWSVTTFGGGRFDLPPLRGDDVQFAYTPGKTWKPKEADSRVITLTMWAVGADPDTGVPAADARLAFNDNWNLLRRLFWRPKGTQVTLTRRWLLTDPNTGLGSMQVASGLAQIAGPMQPTMTGRTRAEFSVDLLMADPFFYGPPATATVNLGASTVVTNPGDDIAAHSGVTVDLVGPLTNPTLLNLSTDPTSWVSLDGALVGGQTVRLDVARFTVAVTAGGGSVRVGQVSGNARRWLRLLRGDNELQLTAAAGSGHAVVTYRPPHV